MKKLAVCLSCLCLAPWPARAQTPTYTNADLERVSPLRAETGGENEPPPAEKAPAERRASEARAHDESTWRAEARRVAAAAARLRDKAADLRGRAQEQRDRERDAPPRRAGAGARPGRAAERLEEQARRAEARAEALELELWERARRARALPGWLR